MLAEEQSDRIKTQTLYDNLEVKKSNLDIIKYF